MSSLYTTKSLGRTWLPSPVRNARRPRYGSWPSSNSPKLRWLSSEPQGTKRWSKIHERFALLALVCIFGIWWCTCNSTTLQRLSFYLPTWPFSSSPEIELATDELAYATYASNTADLCSAVMHFESLHRLSSLPQRLLLYPSSWNTTSDEAATRLLSLAETSYNTTLLPISPKGNPHQSTTLPSTNLLVLDLSSTILRPFDDITIPPAGGKSKKGRAGRAITLYPSTTTTQALQKSLAFHTITDYTISSYPPSSSFSNLEILTTASLRTPPLKNTAKTSLESSNLVHFTDAPPWKPLLETDRLRLAPQCPLQGIGGQQQQQECEPLEIWKQLYNDYRARRKDICGEHFNEWEYAEDMDAANRRIIPLADRVRGVGGNSGAV